MSKDKEKTVDIGLDIRKLDVEVLEKVLSEAERSIRKYLAKNIGMEYLSDTTIILKAEIINNKVVFTIDTHFSAPKVLNLDYEKILDEAIERTFKIIERRLKSLGGEDKK
ncbi:MAG TPA: hypothetical protein EYH40_00465 [Desulfurococcales archaeon]|nr:hypothetical protein [Desulfurococcales archaeon]